MTVHSADPRHFFDEFPRFVETSETGPWLDRLNARYVALIDAQRLDHYHRLERERIHLLLIDEAGKGLDDIAAGRVKDARGVVQSIKRRRSA